MCVRHGNPSAENRHDVKFHFILVNVLLKCFFFLLLRHEIALQLFTLIYSLNIFISSKCQHFAQKSSSNSNSVAIFHFHYPKYFFGWKQQKTGEINVRNKFDIFISTRNGRNYTLCEYDLFARMRRLSRKRCFCNK